eukprot:scaffold20356_cov125-Isochrysis_galbana.AAC.11
MRPKPVMMFLAKSGEISSSPPSSSTRRTSAPMSYGKFGSSGTMRPSAGSCRDRTSSVERTGGLSRLEPGRKPTSARRLAIASRSLAADR